MGKLIEFYIPANYRAPQAKWVPEAARGKVLAFSGAIAAKKSA